MDKDSVSRRKLVALAAVALPTPLLAGCAEEGTPAEEEGGDVPAQGDDPGETGGDGQQGNDSAETGGETGEDGDATGDGDDAGGAGGEGEGAGVPEGWQGVDVIRFEAYTEAWQGLEPEVIAGEDNPTLVLAEGAEYVVEFTNGDAVPHQFALLDGDGESVVESDTVDDQDGATESQAFRATPELEEYHCTHHPDSMVGDVRVEAGDDGEGE